MTLVKENRLMMVDIEYVVRQMRETDIGSVVALEGEVFPDAWPPESFRESVKVADGGGLIVEEKIGFSRKLVAYACYYSSAGETHVTNFAVAPDYRRRGIANRMMESLFEKAGASDSEAMFLEVRVSNNAAQKLYVSHGFHELYRRKNYYHDPREDAVVYTRDLPRPRNRSTETESVNQSNTLKSGKA